MRVHAAASCPAFFDGYAEQYDTVLNAALSASGETKEYFAHGRMRWLATRLRRHGRPARRVLDYGCGTGTSIPLFFEYLDCAEVVGVDVSPRSLDCARRLCHALSGARLLPVDQHEPRAAFDLAFSNGVFHHVAPAERPAAIKHVYDSLRPGGAFAFWENNPWNPGARYSMRVNPFDRDAVPISAVEGRRLLRSAGFRVIETTYLFYFPRPLRVFRFLEPALARFPLGAQYLLLAAKPTTGQ
ncbi:MAG TPA: methyltransferase [Pirellulales bacterium]